MPNITQKISSYVHGISQQPDHLKKSGQVNDALNVIPDVTLGLVKRPGSELISTLNTTKEGKWFTIFRDTTEKYIGQYLNGSLRMWSLIDGSPRVIRYNSTPDLVNPDDGGVGLPANFGASTAPAATLKVAPVLPSTCNPALMKAKLDIYLAQKSLYDSQVSAITSSNKDYEYKQANLFYYALYSSPEYSNGVRTGGIWVRTGTAPTAPSGYSVGPKRYSNVNGEFLYQVYATSVYAKYDGYDLLKLNGSYTQAQVDAAKSAADAAQLALQPIEASLVVKRKAYEVEAVKCGVAEDGTVSSGSSTTTTVVQTVPYLLGADPTDVEVLTVNDYTFFTNKKRIVSMGSTTANSRPYEAFINLKTLEYNTEYSISFSKPGSTADVLVPYATALTIDPGDWDEGDGTCPFTQTATYDKASGSKVNMRYQIETRGQAVPVNNSDPYSGYKCRYKTYVTLVNGGQGWVTGDSWTQVMQGKTYTIRVASHAYKTTYPTLINTTPKLLPKDAATGTVTYSSILSYFKSQIDANYGWLATVIGTGLYVTGPSEFQVNATGGRTDDAIISMTNKVNNISRLPLQCKDGYVVKILNTGDNKDDYYVKFVGTTPGIDGPGAWEETIKPGILVNFNYGTMPHQLVRMPDSTFMFSPVDWDDRLVGDDDTNLQPSFVNSTINKMFFYRNRLGMLSGENLILSRSGDFFNFWSKTAITISDADPIDLAASSTTPCTLYSAVGMKVGLMVFSKDKQFLFGTSQDLLTPQTAKIETLSTYTYNVNTPLIDMGTTVGFLSESGKWSRYFEMTGISSSNTPEIIEQSKIIPELIPVGATEIAQSKENTFIAMAERGTPDLFVYKFFNNGQERMLSSWIRWRLDGNIIHHTVDKDIYYAVTSYDTEVNLVKVTLTINSGDLVVNNTDVTYGPRLDNRRTALSSAITFNPSTYTSSFTLNSKYRIADAVAFGIGNTKFQGRVDSFKTITTNTDGISTYTLSGDWSDTSVAVGYPFDMTVEIPTIHWTKTSTSATTTDTRSYLNLHRCKFQFGDIGMFDATVTHLGKDDYTNIWEQSPADNYKADTHEVIPTALHTVPIYDKNTNASITLHSKHPTPTVLLSMEWEGKLSTKHYTSV
jgi:hypothetical protein